MSEKVELSEKILAVDQNVRELWDAMDDDQRKSLKSELFILNRYISNVSAPKQQWQKGKRPSREEQEHFVLTVNEYFNKNWFLLQKNHSKLLWLLLCMCSYDGKTQYFHEWIGHKKKEGNSKKIKILAEIYPNKKMDDLATLSKMITDKELKELAKDHGIDDKEIAKKLK